MKSKRILFTLLTSFLLFILGFYYYQKIQNLFLSFIPDINFQYTGSYTVIYQSLFFGFVLFLFPILFYILWNRFNIRQFKTQFLIIGIFMFTAISAVIIKNFLLKIISETPFTSTVIAESSHGMEANISFYDAEILNYPLFIFISQIITFLILYLVMRKRQTHE